MASKISKVMRKLRSALPAVQAEAAYEISAMLKGCSPTGALQAMAERFVVAGAIPVLVHLLESSLTVEAQQVIAYTLLLFSLEDAFRKMIAEAGGVHALVKLVRSGPLPVQGAAMTALAYVMSYSGGHTQATLGVAAQATPSAIQMLRNGPEVKHREAAVQFLAALMALDDDSRAAVAQAANVIPLIVQMLGSSSITLQAQSARAIRSLVLSKQTLSITSYRDSILAAGAVPLLARILLQPGSKETEDSAEQALQALCWEDPQTPDAKADRDRTRLAEAGVIPPLVRLIASEKPETKSMALLVFSRLTLNVECCQRAAEAGAIPVLERFIENGPEERRRRAELALYNISLVQNNTDIRSEVSATAGATTTIIQVLRSPVSAPELHEIAAVPGPRPPGSVPAVQREAVAATVLSPSEEGSGLGPIILADGDSPASSKLLEASSPEPVALLVAGARSFTESAASAGSAGGAASKSAGTWVDTSASSAIPENTESVAVPALQQQQPLPAAKRKKSCWSCGAEGARLKKCSGCAVAAYCGAACQKADWKAHKGQCAELKAAATTAADASHR